MKTGIVIINYNRPDLLEKCLVSVFNLHEIGRAEIIVVDNGSTDQSVAIVREKFPKARLVEVEKNSGYSYVNNLGINLALQLGCQAVILMNNDVEVEPEFLTQMEKSIDLNQKIGMVSSKVVLNENLKIDGIGLAITPDGISKNFKAGNLPEQCDQPMEVFCPYAAAGLYTKELLMDISQEGQFLDEDFGFYLEELDLGWRARWRGWRCRYAPAAVAYHHKSATTGLYSEFSSFYTNRNIFLNIIKNYPLLYLVKAILLSVVRYLLLIIGLATKKGAGHKVKGNIGALAMIKIILKGWLSVLILLPRMLRKRRYIHKRRMVSKREVKRWFKELGLGFWEGVYK